MIISDSLQYVFVEIPQTASSAIHDELIAHYDGRPVLFKHSSYKDFLRHAKPEQREFRVIATVRNPLNIVVSKYHKAATDHHGNAELSTKEIKAKGDYLSKRDRKSHEYIRSGASFESYFGKFYKNVYNSRACQLPSEKLLLMRYESLANDFKTVVEQLGADFKGPLPNVNVTKKNSRSLDEYYTPAIRPKAVRVFGPYMNRWNYDFPETWGKIQVPAFSRTLLKLDDFFRTLHYDYFHFPVRRLMGQGKRMP